MQWLAAGWLGRRELATVYMMLLISLPLCILYRGALESGVRNLHESLSSKPSYHWMKPWIGPAGSSEAIAGYFDDPERPLSLAEAAAHAVPWRAWLLPMLYWGTMFLSFQAFWLFLVALFRKRWLDEERLPLPWTQAAMQVIDEAGGGQGTAGVPHADPLPMGEGQMDAAAAEERLKRKSLRWALAIGLGITIPGLLPSIWAGFSSPIGVPPSPETFGVDLTPLGLFEGVELHLVFDPFVIAAALFLPPDFLLTMFLTFVCLRMIFPWLMARFGMPGYSGWIERRMYMALRTGGLVGVPLWMLYYSRDHFWNVLRTLLGKRADAAGGQAGASACQVSESGQRWRAVARVCYVVLLVMLLIAYVWLPTVTWAALVSILTACYCALEAWCWLMQRGQSAGAPEASTEASAWGDLLMGVPGGSISACRLRAL